MRAVQRDIGDVMTRLGKNSTCSSLLGLIGIILHLTVEGWADSVSNGGKEWGGVGQGVWRLGSGVGGWVGVILLECAGGGDGG